MDVKNIQQKFIDSILLFSNNLISRDRATELSEVAVEVFNKDPNKHTGVNFIAKQMVENEFLRKAEIKKELLNALEEIEKHSLGEIELPTIEESMKKWEEWSD